MGKRQGRNSHLAVLCACLAISSDVTTRIASTECHSRTEGATGGVEGVYLASGESGSVECERRWGGSITHLL